MAREQIKTQYSGWQNWINVENRGFSKIGLKTPVGHVLLY
jgi:hypothetical protein